MAQHDYIIDNASGSAVRADLNNALQAIATANSGATEPSTTHAHQLWADTTSGNLKIRNGADSSWIEVGSLSSANLGMMLASRFPNVTSNVTASHTELNKLDGVTASTAEINLLDGKSSLLENIQGAYPVGSIYMNASNSTNPATLLGFGSWSAFGQGRVLVGLDSTQSEFDSIGETGGTKTETLSVSQIPTHGHPYRLSPSSTPSSGSANGFMTSTSDSTQSAYSGTVSSSSGQQIGGEGGGGSHNNLQPYITVYMWKRDS